MSKVASNYGATTAGGEEAVKKACRRAIEVMGVGRWHVVLTVGTAGLYASDAIEATLLTFLYECAGSAFDLTPSYASSIVGIVFVGEGLSALWVGATSDAGAGRATITVASAFCVALFGIASALAPGYGVLIAARFMVGVGVGTFAVTYDMLAEFLPSEDRALTLNYVNLGWSFGCLYMVGAAWVLLPYFSWRALVLAAAIPAALACVCLYFVVEESAFYLAARGDFLGAAHVLRNVARRSNDTSHKTNEALNQLDKTVAAASRDKDLGLVADSENGDNGVAAAGSSSSSSYCSRLGKALEAFAAKFRVLHSGPYVRTSLLVDALWADMGLCVYSLYLLVARIFAETSSELECKFHYAPMFEAFTATVAGVLLLFPLVHFQNRRALRAGLFVAAAASMAPLVSEDLVHNTTAATLCLFCALVCTTCVGFLLWVQAPEFFPTHLRSTGHTVAYAVSRAAAAGASYLVNETYSVSFVAAVIVGVHLVSACISFALPETTNSLLLD